MRTIPALSIILFLIMISCNAQKSRADLLLTNGKVYTVDREFSTAEALAIRDHRIIAVGTSGEMLRKFNANEVVDLHGAFVYPGPCIRAGSTRTVTFSDTE